MRTRIVLCGWLLVVLAACLFLLTVEPSPASEKKAPPKSTYILLTVSQRPEGLVISSHEEINNLKDLQRVVAVMASRYGELLEARRDAKGLCPCGASCKCINCDCLTQNPVDEDCLCGKKCRCPPGGCLKVSTKLPRVSCDEDENGYSQPTYSGGVKCDKE